MKKKKGKLLLGQQQTVRSSRCLGKDEENKLTHRAMVAQLLSIWSPFFLRFKDSPYGRLLMCEKSPARGVINEIDRHPIFVRDHAALGLFEWASIVPLNYCPERDSFIPSLLLLLSSL